MSRPGVKIRIFIADDHPIVRQGLRRIVEADPGMVISGEADGAAALLAGLETKATDLVLLDVSMPGGLFLETLRELRNRQPSIRVLALSVHPEDEWAVRALKAGASGYLTKDHSPDQLLDAIRRWRSGWPVSSMAAVNGPRTSCCPIASSKSCAGWAAASPCLRSPASWRSRLKP